MYVACFLALASFALAPSPAFGRRLAPQSQAGVDSGFQSPRAVIKRTTDAVATAVLDEKLSDREKRKQVMDVVNPVVDFQTVSKLVLAKNYRKFSKQQLKIFVREFKQHMLFTYWKDAKAANFDSIEITGDRKEKRKDWTVKTMILQAGDKTFMDYRLRLFGADEKNEGQWRIIDVTIEGVSLVANFRSQFQSIVADKGPDRLLELLANKNAESEKEGEEGSGK